MVDRLFSTLRIGKCALKRRHFLLCNCTLFPWFTVVERMHGCRDGNAQLRNNREIHHPSQSKKGRGGRERRRGGFWSARGLRGDLRHMETLRSVFPAVPDAALRRAVRWRFFPRFCGSFRISDGRFTPFCGETQLDMCDGSVEAASEWILEHDWRELEREEEGDAEGDATAGGAAQGEGEGHEEAADGPRTMVVSAGNMAGELPARERRREAHGPQRYFARSAMLGARFEDSGGENGGDSEDDDDDGDDEDEDDEDEDEDDDDEDDDDDDPNEFYDSGDDSYMHRLLPPLAKRVKVTHADADDKANQPSADGFWVAFDDVVVTKNLIGTTRFCICGSTTVFEFDRMVPNRNRAFEHHVEQARA